MNIAAVVLAAGSASRFGGGKLLATLDGRPLLQHVLDALADSTIDRVVVVLGAEARAIESAIAWRRERRVTNPRPEDGLASSLRLGVAAATALEPAPDAILVCLGDQPRTSPATIRALVAAAGETDRPILVPRHAGDGARNPVLLARAAWPLVDRAGGDRGLGPLLASNPELVTEIPVEGDNPDVDTRADLARIGGRGERQAAGEGEGGVS